MAGRRRCNRETDLRSNTVSATAVAGKQPRLWNRPGGALVVFALLATGTPSAGGQEKAPRHPPEPFRVFVHTSDPADAALKAKLEEAIPMVRERVERRRKWFRLAVSAETADVTLRIVNHRTGRVRDPPYRGNDTMPGVWVNRGRAYHFVDAVVWGGGVSVKLSGLDEGHWNGGSGLRNAAGQLAKELERFCKDNYGPLRQLRTETRPDEPGDGGAAPRSHNTSPSRD